MMKAFLPFYYPSLFPEYWDFHLERRQNEVILPLQELVVADYSDTPGEFIHIIMETNSPYVVITLHIDGSEWSVTPQYLYESGLFAEVAHAFFAVACYDTTNNKYVGLFTPYRPVSFSERFFISFTNPLTTEIEYSLSLMYVIYSEELRKLVRDAFEQSEQQEEGE